MDGMRTHAGCRWYQDDGERRLGGLKEFTKMRLEEIVRSFLSLVSPGLY